MEKGLKALEGALERADGQPDIDSDLECTNISWGQDSPDEENTEPE